VPEGIALLAPVLQHAVEGVLLHQDADAHILPAGVAGLEQPAIDFLPLVDAGVETAAPRGASTWCRNDNLRSANGE